LTVVLFISGLGLPGLLAKWKGLGLEKDGPLALTGDFEEEI
jgi:hypothetical protein